VVGVREEREDPTVTRKLLVGALAVGALAVTAGTAVALSGQEQPTPTSSSVPTSSFTESSTTESSTTESSPTSTGDPTSTVPVDPLISRDEAIRIAQERVGGGDVTEVETELEHGRPEWKIELHVNGVEHDVRVDAQTGDITRVDSDDDRHDDRHDDRDDKDDQYDDD
jgi:hypothetical protein